MYVCVCVRGVVIVCAHASARESPRGVLRGNAHVQSLALVRMHAHMPVPMRMCMCVCVRACDVCARVFVCTSIIGLVRRTAGLFTPPHTPAPSVMLPQAPDRDCMHVKYNSYM